MPGEATARRALGAGAVAASGIAGPRYALALGAVAGLAVAVLGGRRQGYPHFHSPAYPHLYRRLSCVFTQILHRLMHRLFSWQTEAAGEQGQREPKE
jgi:hypothetical protein